LGIAVPNIKTDKNGATTDKTVGGENRAATKAVPDLEGQSHNTTRAYLGRFSFPTRF
jgi:hypothetical protein